MDDLVVIILTLVIAGFGLLGQIRKQKQNQSNPTPDNSPGNFWDMLKNGMEPPTQEVETESYDDLPEEDTMEARQTPVYEFKTQRKGRSLLEERKISENMEKSSQPKFKKGFSLRDAVIYNEILDRKYK